MVNTAQNSEIDENGESLVRNDTSTTLATLNNLEKRTESELVVENSEDIHANFLKSEVQEENDGKEDDEELDVIEEENKNI